jgi:hypothetical protein
MGVISVKYSAHYPLSLETGERRPIFRWGTGKNQKAVNISGDKRNHSRFERMHVDVHAYEARRERDRRLLSKIRCIEKQELEEFPIAAKYMNAQDILSMLARAHSNALYRGRFLFRQPFAHREEEPYVTSPFMRTFILEVVYTHYRSLRSKSSMAT